MFIKKIAIKRKIKVNYIINNLTIYIAIVIAIIEIATIIFIATLITFKLAFIFPFLFYTNPLIFIFLLQDLVQFHLL